MYNLALVNPVSNFVCLSTDCASTAYPALPVLRVGVLEQFSQLQRVLADLLHGRQQEAVQRDVNHLLQQAARLEEEDILVDLHQLGELQAGVGVVVAVLGVDLEICLLQWTRYRFIYEQTQSNKYRGQVNRYRLDKCSDRLLHESCTSCKPIHCKMWQNWHTQEFQKSTFRFEFMPCLFSLLTALEKLWPPLNPIDCMYVL